MINENGIRAFSDDRYDYYELQKDFGPLKKGSIFVHDPDDRMYGSIAQGCLKLCWTPEGNCYSDLCANTVFLHYKFARDKSIFKLVKKTNTKQYKIKAKLVIDLETDLEDEERPTEETVKFLIDEDLQDLGYDINQIKVKKIDIEEINN